MYGRIFASMFTGSMVGKGSPVFAVMSYVIANMRPDKEVGAQVDLNVPLLAFTIGEPPEIIQKAIDYLCSPDPHTTTPGDEGRRLVKVGSYAYKVVNGPKYLAIRNAEEHREAARIRKSLQREREEQASKLSTFVNDDSKRTSKPTLEEVKLLCTKAVLPSTEAEKFWNFYESKGWKVGKVPMKSVAAAVAGWAARWKESNCNTNGRQPSNIDPDYYMQGNRKFKRTLPAGWSKSRAMAEYSAGNIDWEYEGS